MRCAQYIYQQANNNTKLIEPFYITSNLCGIKIELYVTNVKIN